MLHLMQWVNGEDNVHASLLDNDLGRRRLPLISCYSNNQENCAQFEAVHCSVDVWMQTWQGP